MSSGTMAERPNSSTTSRPKPKMSHSFPRMDASPTSPRKIRSNTLTEQGIIAVPAPRSIDTTQESDGKKHVTDVFEANHNEEESDLAESGTGTPGPGLNLPSTFDDLPIEIKSLTERFLESLYSKVHPTPLTADALSSLFQDFYERAASHIATHIASLSSRIGRDASPAPINSSRNSIKSRSRAGSEAKRLESSPNNSGGEMLTASEVTDRKRARRLLELKRVALEEAVERAVCEKVYEKIWKHKSTDDDARDEKLRSRTAALALVGIGLKELRVDAMAAESSGKAPEEKEDEVHQSLAEAREALQRMDKERYPLGKLRHLTAAHKSIVDTLSQLFPSSSSADEILPTLIYTLITSPPEGINVVSNLCFIQRFRATSKVDGEAAYCMVNLEASISFLETIDLTSLRADELPQGPPKSNSTESFSTTPNPATLLEKALPAQAVKPNVTTATATAQDTSSSPTEAIKALPALPSPRTPTAERPSMTHQRRISAMMQAQADRIEAGRENFLNTADKIVDSINGTLENSLQFVFGRFKDQSSDSSPLPKTLEDARKLVSSPRLGEDEDGLDISGRSSPAIEDPLSMGGRSERVVELIGGKKGARDRSVDSARSASSGRRVLFADGKDKPKDESSTTGPGNLFATINTINPLNRFQVPSFAPSFARFGRSGSLSQAPKDHPSPGVEKSNRLDDIVESPVSARGGEMPALEKIRSRDSNAGDDLNARETIAELRKLTPPKKRFLEVQTVGDLKISEVEELLLDYRRLAKAIGEAIAQ